MTEFNKEVFNDMINSDGAKDYIKETYGVENLNGLVNKRDELLANLSSAQTELKQYKSFGDIETIADIKNTVDTIRSDKEKTLLESNDFAAKEQYLNDQLEAAKTQLETLQTTLVSDKITATLTTAIAKAKGDTEVLLPLLSQRIKGEINDGNVDIAIYDGKDVAHVDGERMTIDQLIDSFKTKHPNLFEVSASGSGTQPNQVSRTQNATYDFNDPSFNLSKAASRVKKNGSYESITKKYGWR